MEALRWWRGVFGSALRHHIARVARTSNGVVQGTPEWLALKGTLIGGSELAVLLGTNPYMKWEALVAKKLGLLPPDKFGVACWWGTMFEPVTERFVALDCDTALVGTDIHMRIPAFQHHANSPDGFCVVCFELDDDGDWVLSHDPAGAVAAGRPTQALPAVVELKAPYSRKPSGTIPRYYLPQVWSGLEFTPDAAFGLYVETVYRLCSLGDLGDSDAYALGYHKGDTRTRRGEKPKPVAPIWGLPVAWGATAVYAPYADGEAGRGAGAKAALLGMRAVGKLLGHAPARADLGTQAVDVGDLADRDPKAFEALLGCINAKTFRVAHCDPKFATGPHAPADPLSPFLDGCEAAAPPGFYLLGLLGWKVFRADYHVVHRRPGFADEVRALTAEFMGDVNRLLAVPEGPLRRAAYQRYCGGRARAAAAEFKKSGREPNKVNAAERAGIFAIVRSHTIS